MSEEKVVDCVGLSCPQPVIRTKEALEDPEAGWIRVIVDNEASCANVRRFAESQGYVVEVHEQEGQYHIRIQRGEGISVSADAEVPSCRVVEGRKTVIYISSEGMGRGDDELGHILMAAYLDTLSQFVKELSHLVFVNTGVKLVVEGSPVLEQIQQLERAGVEVLACGTCLNHFGLKEKIRVGTVSNMYSILEVLSAAGKVLSP